MHCFNHFNHSFISSLIHSFIHCSTPCFPRRQRNTRERTIARQHLLLLQKQFLLLSTSFNRRTSDSNSMRPKRLQIHTYINVFIHVYTCFKTYHAVIRSRSVIHSFMYSSNHSFSHPFQHSFFCVFIHSFIHSIPFCFCPFFSFISC